MKRELLRKALHAMLAGGFAYSALYVQKETILFLALCLLGIFLLIRGMRLYTPMHKVPRISYGELFFPLGVIGALLLSWQSILAFQVAMLVLALADPLAGLVGMHFGKHIYHVYKEKRSYEGSLTCCLVVFVIFITFGVTTFSALVSSVVLMFVEAVSLRGSDNLLLPTVSVLVFQYFT